jgi:RNA polymerase sigma factor (sigma-70 family)
MTIEEALQVLAQSPKDHVAWDRIIGEVYEPLIAYVASLLVSFRLAAVAAHDIVNDVLLTFYRRCTENKERLNFSNGGEIQAYLRKSCRNRLIDRCRRENSAEKMLKFLTLKYSEAIVENRDPDQIILTDQIIASLPKDCQFLVKKYVKEDLTPAEVADFLRISPRAFYARWHRCLEKAREIFPDCS